MAKKITYSEPSDYIPESVRKKLGLGEFSPEGTTAPSNSAKKATATKGTAKKSK